MKTLIYQKTLGGLVDFVGTLRGSNKVLNATKALEVIRSFKEEQGCLSATKVEDIFSKLTEKNFKPGKLCLDTQPKTNIKLTFRSLDTYNYTQTSSETWLFQFDTTPKDTGKTLNAAQLTNMLLMVAETSKDLVARQTPLQSRIQKNSFVDYGIQYNSQDSQSSIPTNTTKLQFMLPSLSIRATVTIETASGILGAHSAQIGRKLSSDTNYTEENRSMSSIPKLARRVSLYSYYDHQNDITVLSNDLSFVQGDYQQQSMVVQDEEDQECELIETEEDQRLSAFSEALRELGQREEDPFYLTC